MSDPNALGLSIKTQAIAALQLNGQPVPDRVFFTAGNVVIEPELCEQLAVTLERLYYGKVGQPFTGGLSNVPQTARCADYQVVLTRCVPLPANGGAPTAQDMEQTAELVALDGWWLTRGLRAAWAAGDLGGCTDLAIVESSASGIEGGRLSWVLKLAVEL